MGKSLCLAEATTFSWPNQMEAMPASWRPWVLVVTTLGVYKPWGLTRYGRRKRQERKVQQQPENESPLGVKIFYAVIGVLVLVVVVLHLTGHGFGSHGH